MKNPQPPAPRPVPELAQLEAGLEALARAGRVAQCVAQDAWISDDAEDRAAAAEGCTWCPLTAPCLAAGLAVRATWGVFGGTYRSRRPRDAPSRPPCREGCRVTAYALVHDPDCPSPSTFYEVRPSGYAWLSCRRCWATALRRIPKKETTP